MFLLYCYQNLVDIHSIALSRCIRHVASNEIRILEPQVQNRRGRIGPRNVHWTLEWSILTHYDRCYFLLWLSPCNKRLQGVPREYLNFCRVYACSSSRFEVVSKKKRKKNTLPCREHVEVLRALLWLFKLFE